MSQTELATVGSVGKTAQINYEKGQRSPDAAYLAAVAGVGVDVLYVVTGKLSTALAPVDAARMTLIVERLERIAQDAGKRRPAGQLTATAVEVYNFLLEEVAVDDDKLDRVLRLVVNR